MTNMTVREIANAFDKFPGDAILKCGLSIPSLYINTVANLSISANTENPGEATEIRIVAQAPPQTPQFPLMSTNESQDENTHKSRPV